MNVFGGTPSAPYPTTGYPASAFFGATSLQPAVGNGQNTNGPANPTDTRTLLIVVGAVIVGGFVVFHLYNR